MFESLKEFFFFFKHEKKKTSATNKSFFAVPSSIIPHQEFPKNSDRNQIEVIQPQIAQKPVRALRVTSVERGSTGIQQPVVGNNVITSAARKRGVVCASRLILRATCGMGDRWRHIVVCAVWVPATKVARRCCDNYFWRWRRVGSAVSRGMRGDLSNREVGRPFKDEKHA